MRAGAAAREDACEPTVPGRRSLRDLTGAAFLVIGVLASAAIAGLLWSAHLSRRATNEAIRATRTQALVDEASVGLLTHRRLADLWVVTREPELAQARDQTAHDVTELLELASTTVTDERERALLRVAAMQADAYFDARARLEARSPHLPTIVAAVRPQLDRVTRTLAVTRELDRRDVETAHADIERATVVSDVVGGSLAALLVGSLVFLLAALRRWVIAPLLELHDVITRLRRGDTSARAPERGVREICDLAHAYNGMADTLAAQRDGQLTYLAGVAHDLRNPLGALKTGLAVVECYEGTERSRRTLGLLGRQVDRIARMVSDLLDAARIESGRLEMKHEPVDLCERAHDAVDLFAPSYPSHEIVLTKPTTPVVIEGDPGRIDQVINNLLSNALKFSPGGGRVDVCVAREGRTAKVEVVDRGIGMTNEEMRDLFAPFRRRAPEIAPGAGLGLSIVRRIVEAHGGHVEVESRPKHGSTFRAVFPAYEAGGDAARRQPSTRGSGG